MSGPGTTAASRTDPCTCANLDQVTYKHLALDLDVDFDARVIRGCATWRLSLSEACTLIKLDTKSLSITSVRACAALDLPADASPHTDLSKMSSEIPFTLVEHPLNPHAFGSALTISLTEMVGADGGVLPQGDILLAIHYRTASDSIALQWLTPEQTAGKQYPYVFSQCQAIHARALLPCPDAPCAKVGYSARLTVPEWATAVMSAPAAGRERLPDGTKHRFDFEQEVPIPSYLLALAVGELESRVVGPRSKVWAEPSVVDAAAYEFSETESFICAAEKIAGMPYAWGSYDILCMPPSFPYGGMENPCLTFVTPTLLAGDRSLADVVAHEIAHSWTGNLVTNHTWEHFWLNEGWTMWLERRILAALHGEPHYDFSARSGVSALEASVRGYGEDSPYTVLVPSLKGVDPDDVFSSVPYEKGFALLHHLSSVIGGRAQFEAFFKAYVANFASKTLTSDEFRTFATEWSVAQGIDISSFDWEGWFTSPGMPLVPLDVSDTMGADCDALAHRWLSDEIDEPADSFREADLAGWASPLRVCLLDKLLGRAEGGTPLPIARLRAMDAAYGFGNAKNAEIRFRWQKLGICSRDASVVPDALAFLTEQGRMKYVRPLYKALHAWPEQREKAVETFVANRSNYHPIAAKMLAQDLQISTAEGDA